MGEGTEGSYLRRRSVPLTGTVTRATCCLANQQKLTRRVRVWSGLALQWWVGAQVSRIPARLTWSVYLSTNPPAF